jgi:hypothetical protein
LSGGISDDINGSGDTYHIVTLGSTGNSIFGQASSLHIPKMSGLVLPNTLSNLADRAFSACTNLTGTLVIPAGVTSVPAAGGESEQAFAPIETVFDDVFAATVNTHPTSFEMEVLPVFAKYHPACAGMCVMPRSAATATLTIFVSIGFMIFSCDKRKYDTPNEEEVSSLGIRN